MRVAEFLFHHQVDQAIVPILDELFGIGISDELYEVDLSVIDASAKNITAYAIDNYLIALDDVKEKVKNIEEVATALEVFLEYGVIKIYQVDLGTLALKNGRSNSFMRFKTFLKQQGITGKIADFLKKPLGFTEDTKLYEVDYRQIDPHTAEMNPPKSYISQYGLITTSFLCDFVLRTYIEKGELLFNYKGMKVYQTEEFPPHREVKQARSLEVQSVPEKEQEVINPTPVSPSAEKPVLKTKPEPNPTIVKVDPKVNPRHNKQMDKLKNTFAQHYVNTSKKLEEQRGEGDIDADFLRKAFQKKNDTED